MFSSRARSRIAASDQATPIGGVYSLFDPRPSMFSKTVYFVGDVDSGGSTQQAVLVAVLKK